MRASKIHAVAKSMLRDPMLMWQIIAPPLILLFDVREKYLLQELAKLPGLVAPRATRRQRKMVAAPKPRPDPKPSAYSREGRAEQKTDPSSVVRAAVKR